jgi:hypothetical protein
MIGTVAQKLGALLFADCQQTIDIVVAEHFGHGSHPVLFGAR